MLCPYCNRTREYTMTPCVYCGAPSPLSNGIQSGNQGTAPAAWFQQFPQSGPLPSQENQAQASSIAMLPVPYQGNNGYNGYNDYPIQQMDFAQSGANMQMVPFPTTDQMPSTFTDGTIIQNAPSPVHDEAPVVYVPPMYTKPRPIIPRYRIISGFLSFVIVMSLLISGAVYYAQASGKFDALRQMLGAMPPPNLHVSPTAVLPDPPARVDMGPAYSVIPSGIVTFHVDAKNPFFALQPDSVIPVKQIFYVIYSVQSPKTAGTVTVKWYTNGNLFNQEQSQTIPANGGVYNGRAKMQYPQPAEGMVELYWNNQLAQRLYFVVR